MSRFGFDSAKPSVQDEGESIVEEEIDELERGMNDILSWAEIFRRSTSDFSKKIEDLNQEITRYYSLIEKEYQVFEQ